jgi:hypothetical protein
MVKYFPPGQDFTFDKSFGFTGSAQGRHDALDHTGEADDDAYGDGSYVERARGGAVNRGTPAHERFEGDNANNLPLNRGGRVKRAKGGAVPSTVHPGNPHGWADGGGVAETGGKDIPVSPTDMEIWQGAGGWLDKNETEAARERIRRQQQPEGHANGGRIHRADGGLMVPTSRPPNATPQPGMGALGRATITMPVADAARAASGMVQAGRAIGAGRGAARAPMPAIAPGAATALGAARPPVGGAMPGMKEGGKVRHKGFHPGGTPGKLHKEIGVPEGQKIPAGRLEAATHSSNPEVRRDAIRAETMKKWHHG